MDYGRIASNIRTELRNYLAEHKLCSMVIGQSGGIDSALCTVLAAPVAKEIGAKLISRSLTIETNSQGEIDRAAAIGSIFCTDFQPIDLTEAYLQLMPVIDGAEAAAERHDKVRRGNIKARLRMIYLYNMAQKNQGIVLSTDNYTELLQGFWTLHGDVGDYGMIQNLWKTEVYGLAQWLIDNEIESAAGKQALASCIEALPTDGLGISKSDLEQLGASSYAEVDELLQKYISGERGRHIEEKPVIKRFLATHYKRNNPYNIPRDTLFS
jgi:NAD+ synthase